MNDSNPKIACDAILAGTKEIQGVEIQPMTLARYALLELLKSPFVDTTQEFKVSGLIPTFFVMCNGPDVLRGYTSRNIEELEAKALEWSEKFDVETAPRLIDAIADELGLMKKVAPQDSGETSADGKSSSKKAEARTAG